MRSPQVIKGYWNRPEATAEVLSNDGWLRIGDVAVADPAGHYKIVDRIKDMVIVSGFNVFPVEVDNAAWYMPGILECASIGVPDDKTGEAVVLYVVKADQNLTEVTVRDFCREKLVGYKVPKAVQIVDELPKTNVGKVLRRELRDIHMNADG